MGVWSLIIKVRTDLSPTLLSCSLRGYFYLFLNIQHFALRLYVWLLWLRIEHHILSKYPPANFVSVL